MQFGFPVVFAIVFICFCQHIKSISCLLTFNSYLSYEGTCHFRVSTYKAYFRQTKLPRIERSVKKCPFWKKFFFFIWIKSVQSNFQLGVTRSLPNLLDNLGSLLLNKGALLLKQGALFQEKCDSILYFT